MKVAWITGASSGIGEALSVAYAKESYRLVLSARREDELSRVKNRCLGQGLSDEDVLVIPLDVTRESDMPAAVARVVEHFGQIDLLINNAGISQRSLFVDTEVSVYRTIFDVDVIGPIAMTKAVLPQMLKQQRWTPGRYFVHRREKWVCLIARGTVRLNMPSWDFMTRSGLNSMALVWM